MQLRSHPVFPCVGGQANAQMGAGLDTHHVRPLIDMTYLFAEIIELSRIRQSSEL